MDASSFAKSDLIPFLPFPPKNWVTASLFLSFSDTKLGQVKAT